MTNRIIADKSIYILHRITLKNQMQFPFPAALTQNQRNMPPNCVIKVLRSGLFLPVALALNVTNDRGFTQKLTCTIININPTANFLLMFSYKMHFPLLP